MHGLVHTIAKVLAVLWTLACLAWGILSITASTKATADVIREQQEARLSRPSSDRSAEGGAIAGGACCASLGAGSALFAWFVGVVPLLLIMFIAKPKVVVTAVERGPGTLS